MHYQSAAVTEIRRAVEGVVTRARFNDWDGFVDEALKAGVQVSRIPGELQYRSLATGQRVVGEVIEHDVDPEDRILSRPRLEGLVATIAQLRKDAPEDAGEWSLEELLDHRDQVDTARNALSRRRPGRPLSQRKERMLTPSLQRRIEDRSYGG